MKQRAVLLTHAVRIQEKRLQEEKLLASEQARLDETFNKVQEILALSQETEAKLLPVNGDKARVLEVLDKKINANQLKAFIHAHARPTLDRKGSDFYSQKKLNAAAAASVTKC